MARPSSITLNRSDESEHSCFVSDLKGKNFFSVLPSNVMLMLAVGFCSFYRLTNFPTILRVYRFTDTASDATLQINFKESLLGLHEKTDFFW